MALSDIVPTAQALQDYLTAAGAKQGTNGGVCSAFQQAYNSGGGTPTLKTIDDEYGPCTQAALQAVWDASVANGQGPAQAAPQNAYPGTCSNGQYISPGGGGGGGGGGQITPSPPGALAPGAMPTWAWWLLGGILVLGLGAIWYMSKKKGPIRFRYRLRVRRRAHRSHEAPRKPVAGRGKVKRRR